MSNTNGINRQVTRSALPAGLIIDGRSLGPTPSVKAAGRRIRTPRRGVWLRRLLGYGLLVGLGASLLAFSWVAAYGHFFTREQTVTPAGAPSRLDVPAPAEGRPGDPTEDDVLMDSLRQALAQHHRFVAEHGVWADAGHQKARSEWERRRALRRGSRLGE
jgi:hypothetical protein